MELNNKSIALNILCVPHNTEEIRYAYVPKHNTKRENQLILLMITDGEKWHYLAVKELSELLTRITPKHEGRFSCLNCFHSYSTKNKFKKHYDVCKNHHYCYVEMPEEDKKNIKIQPWGNVNETFIIYLLFIIYYLC